MPKVEILGVHVDVIDADGLYQAIADSIARCGKDVFAYVNINAINIAQENERFRRFLNDAHVVYCDGEGVRLGGRILGYHLPPRIVLTYWIWDLCKYCESRDYSVFLLGASEQHVREAVDRVRERFPHLRIVGYHHGYFAKQGPESDAVVEIVNRADPDILIVGFGMPLQEFWIEEHLGRLNARVILPAGSMIDYTAGRKGLAPAWMANHGLEWLYRFFQEPRRLWKRYLIGNPLFMLRVIRERFFGAKSRRPMSLMSHLFM
ncbi:MAG TPA: WecB/TagA/CpsF family glycosyltransferase [Bacteroidota bacterium]|nr:WecB/TagA/CpsF family glycosyltransferase [Bacteroidota bacterium]